MKLEDIYNIIKESSLDDFYVPSSGTTFIYKNDVNLCIEENEEKTDSEAFGYNYFFDGANKLYPHILTDPNDKLVYDAIKLKDFPETYERGTSIVIWEVKYCNKVIFELNCIQVTNLSSLHILLPLNINTSDYVYNFIEIWNEKHSPNVHFHLRNRLNIKDTTFDDFIDS